MMTRVEMRERLVDRYTENHKIIEEFDHLFKEVEDTPKSNFILEKLVKVYLHIER
ncbi:MAG: hypothetical protein II410_04545 [Ruminococcus sp.]|nr:hypothetical protein [Ruminococcus sp.]